MAWPTCGKLAYIQWLTTWYSLCRAYVSERKKFVVLERVGERKWVSVSGWNPLAFLAFVQSRESLSERLTRNSGKSLSRGKLISNVLSSSNSSVYFVERVTNVDHEWQQCLNFIIFATVDICAFVRNSKKRNRTFCWQAMRKLSRTRYWRDKLLLGS